jgi:PAS domain S-box-containing protein
MAADSQARRAQNDIANPGDISAEIAGILDTVELPIIVVGPDRRIARFNRAAAEVLSLAQLDIGRYIGNVLPAVNDVDSLCRRVIADGTSHQLQIRWADRHFVIRIAPYNASDTRILGAVLTFTNVTAFRACIDQAIYEREYTKAILNTVIEPLVVLDADLRIQTANRAFYTMFHVSREETRNVPFYTLGDSHWKSSGLWESLKRRLSENTGFQPVEVNREFSVIGRRTILIDARRLSSEGSDMLLLALQDITEQKRAQEAVQQRTAQFQTLLNEAPLGVYLIDSDFRIREVNPTALRLFGDIPDLIGRDLGEVLHVLWPMEYADELVERFRYTLETGEPRMVAERIEERRDLGILEYYEWQINRIPLPEGGYGVVCYFRDISTLVKARQEVEKSERHLRNLAETIPQLVWTCLPDGNCDYLSTQWVTYTGIPDAEQLRLRWLDLVLHPDDRQRTQDAWMAAVEDRAPYDIEYRLRRFDGTYRYFRTRGTPVRNSEGAIEKWFGTCTDIEDQKVAERNMLEQQKRESLGLLAGGIAHDFNNLLVGVLGNAGIIEECLEPKHPLWAVVQGIVEAGERAAHLTRQMLAYAGKGRIFVEQVDVNALVLSTASLVEPSFPKSVRLILNTAGQPLAIEADSGQLQQVIMNLAINGAEAVGEDQTGSVRIGTAIVELDRFYLREHKFVGDEPREGTYVCIEVEDTGSGIEPDRLTKIFDPFFSTKFTGRGLGLAAVLGIVRSAHGGIEVSTQVGRGTTFRVFFPASEVAQAIQVVVPDSAIDKEIGRPLVLVIDDEPIVRTTTDAMLRNMGYNVLLAEGGAEALEIFSAVRTEIALVLLDMSMPAMSGKETLERLRAIDDQIPVLIFSGYGEEQVHRHFAGLKIAGFVQKPFTGHQIASAVHALLPATRPQAF